MFKPKSIDSYQCCDWCGDDLNKSTNYIPYHTIVTPYRESMIICGICYAYKCPELHYEFDGEWDRYVTKRIKKEK